MGVESGSAASSPGQWTSKRGIGVGMPVLLTPPPPPPPPAPSWPPLGVGTVVRASPFVLGGVAFLFLAFICCLQHCSCYYLDSNWDGGYDLDSGGKMKAHTPPPRCCDMPALVRRVCEGLLYVLFCPCMLVVVSLQSFGRCVAELGRCIGWGSVQLGGAISRLFGCLCGGVCRCLTCQCCDDLEEKMPKYEPLGEPLDGAASPPTSVPSRSGAGAHRPPRTPASSVSRAVSSPPSARWSAALTSPASSSRGGASPRRGTSHSPSGHGGSPSPHAYGASPRLAGHCSPACSCCCSGDASPWSGGSAASGASPRRLTRARTSVEGMATGTGGWAHSGASPPCALTSSAGHSPFMPSPPPRHSDNARDGGCQGGGYEGGRTPAEAVSPAHPYVPAHPYAPGGAWPPPDERRHASVLPAESQPPSHVEQARPPPAHPTDAAAAGRDASAQQAARLATDVSAAFAGEAPPLGVEAHSGPWPTRATAGASAVCGGGGAQGGLYDYAAESEHTERAWSEEVRLYGVAPGSPSPAHGPSPTTAEESKRQEFRLAAQAAAQAAAREEAREAALARARQAARAHAARLHSARGSGATTATATRPQREPKDGDGSMMDTPRSARGPPPKRAPPQPHRPPARPRGCVQRCSAT